MFIMNPYNANMDAGLIGMLVHTVVVLRGGVTDALIGNLLAPGRYSCNLFVIRNFQIHMGQVMKVGLSCYLVLLSNDS